jgi:hypothetical protein
VTKVVVGIIGIVLLMVMFPMVMSSTHDIQTESQVDADLALSGTPPAGTCTLTVDLWQAEIGSVISIVGNGTEEAGAIYAVSYASATKVLTVTGVSDSTTATVTYEVDGLTDYTGMGSMVSLTPLLIWIAILAAVIGGVWLSFKARG